MYWSLSHLLFHNTTHVGKMCTLLSKTWLDWRQTVSSYTGTTWFPGINYNISINSCYKKSNVNKSENIRKQIMENA